MKEFKGELITSQRFEGVLLDIYRGEDDFLFTSDQLTQAAGFKEEKYLQQLISRNPELRNREFSVLCKVDSMEGGVKNNEKKDSLQKRDFMKFCCLRIPTVRKPFVSSSEGF